MTENKREVPVIAMVLSPGGRLKDGIDELDRGFPEAELHLFERTAAKEHIMGALKELSPDLLITEDLEGFEMTTLTDSLAYNLIHCRQIHLITRHDLPEMQYLAKQLSLVMHFYVTDPLLKEEVLERNGDVPFLETVTNPLAKAIPEIARRVLARGRGGSQNQ